MAKTIVAPLVGFLVLVLKVVFGIEIPDDIANGVIDVLVTSASLGAIIYGIIKNHMKQKDAN